MRVERTIKGESRMIKAIVAIEAHYTDNVVLACIVGSVEMARNWFKQCAQGWTDTHIKNYVEGKRTEVSFIGQVWPVIECQNDIDVFDGPFSDFPNGDHFSLGKIIVEDENPE